MFNGKLVQVYFLGFRMYLKSLWERKRMIFQQKQILPSRKQLNNYFRDEMQLWPCLKIVERYFIKCNFRSCLKNALKNKPFYKNGCSKNKSNSEIHKSDKGNQNN